MGYVGLTINESDTASDMNAQVVKIVRARLTTELETDHGPYNTDGFVNVAMWLVEVASKDPTQWRMLHELAEQAGVLIAGRIASMKTKLDSEELTGVDRDIFQDEYKSLYELWTELIKTGRALEFAEGTN